MSKKKHGTQARKLHAAKQQEPEVGNTTSEAAGSGSSPNGDEESEGRVTRPTASPGLGSQDVVRPFQEIDADEYAEEVREAASKVVFMLNSAGWTDIVAPYLQQARDHLSDVTTIESFEDMNANRAVVVFIDQFIATLEDAKLQGEVVARLQ